MSVTQGWFREVYLWVTDDAFSFLMSSFLCQDPNLWILIIAHEVILVTHFNEVTPLKDLSLHGVTS